VYTRIYCGKFDSVLSSSGVLGLRYSYILVWDEFVLVLRRWVYSEKGGGESAIDWDSVPT